MKRGIYYVMLCLVGFSVLSCNKQLEINPIDQIPDATFWAAERDLDGAVAGAYALLRKTLSESPKNNNDDNGYHPRFYMYGDRRASNFMAVGQDPIRSNIDNDIKVNRLRSVLGGTRQWEDILFNWAAFYQVIEQCNIVLENAHRVPDNQFIRYNRDLYVAEARFIRAFTYFYMVRVWGNVPLVTKSKTTDKLGRTNMNAVLDFVDAELKAAEANLPLQYPETGRNAFRATKGTAYATLAHSLAWRHKDAEAITWATKVIDGGVYKLIKDAKPAPGGSIVNPLYRTIWKGRTVEGIFEIDFDAATGEYGRNGSLANMTLFGGVYSTRSQPYWSPAYMKVDPANGNRAITRISDPKMIYPDSTKDERFLTLLASPVSATVGQTYVFAKYGYAVDPVANLFDANIVIFRMADIILLRAECYARLQNYTAARADLNTIRQRVWLDDWTGADADLYLEIFRERSRELLGEGHYFYDLVRTGFITDPDYNKIPTRPDMTQTDFDEGAWTWPVSQRAFTDNPNMEQLRYWQRY